MAKRGGGGGKARRWRGETCRCERTPNRFFFSATKNLKLSSFSLFPLLSLYRVEARGAPAERDAAVAREAAEAVRAGATREAKERQESMLRLSREGRASAMFENEK